MKKKSEVVFRVMLFILVTCGFTACKKDNAVLNTSESSAFTSSNLKLPATIIDQHFDFPGPYTHTNHCTGEVVTLEGTIGIDMHIVINGNKMNYSEHQQGQLKGIGSLGNTYITNLNENIILNGISSSNGVFINDKCTHACNYEYPPANIRSID